MPHLSPTTRTTDEQRLILWATAGNVRDHTIISLALGTGLRLAEIVSFDVGDVFAPDGTPLGALLPANSTYGLVAGARYVPLQMKLTPLNRYLAGLRWAA